jgi:ATP-dependent protease ClpP protease subunit
MKALWASLAIGLAVLPGMALADVVDAGEADQDVKADRAKKDSQKGESKPPVVVPPPIMVSPAPPPSRTRESLPARMREESEWPKVSASDDGKVIYIVGELMPGSYGKFNRALRANPDAKTVYLASPGGLVMDGFLIASLVRSRGLDAYVEHYCASACTQIFAAGKHRILGRDAQLGYHQSYIEGQGGTPEAAGGRSNRGTSFLEMSYRRSGMPDEFINRALETPPSEMWLPSRDELTEAGIVTDFLEVPTVAPDAKLFHTKLAVSQARPDSPLWNALLASEPELYEEVTLDAWRHANSGLTPSQAWQSVRTDVTDKLDPRFAMSSEDLVDRFTTYMDDVAKFERDRDYLGCTPEALDPVTGTDADIAEYELQADRLYAELLGFTEWREAPNRKSARANIESHVASWLVDSSVIDPIQWFRTDHCVLGLQIFEAIAMLEPEDRDQTMRDLIYYSQDEDVSLPLVAPASEALAN